MPHCFFLAAYFTYYFGYERFFGCQCSLRKFGVEPDNSVRDILERIVDFFYPFSGDKLSAVREDTASSVSRIYNLLAKSDSLSGFFGPSVDPASI